MIFDKGRKAIQQEVLPFQQMVMKQLTIRAKKVNFDLSHTLYKKINIKWIIM